MSRSLDRAWQLFQLSRYDLMEQELRRVLGIDPDQAMAHAMLGWCLAWRRHWVGAEYECREAIRLEPDLAYAFFVLAWTYCRQNDLVRAEPAIREALRLRPRSPDYLDLLACIQSDRRNYAGALASADQGLEIDPEHVGCLNSRAMALLYLKKEVLAEETIRRALVRDPEDSRTHTNLALILSARKKYDEAVAHMRESLRIDPECRLTETGLQQETLRLLWVARGKLLVGLFAVTFFIGLFVFNAEVPVRNRDLLLSLLGGTAVVLAVPVVCCSAPGLLISRFGRTLLRCGQVRDTVIALLGTVGLAAVSGAIGLAAANGRAMLAPTVAAALALALTFEFTGRLRRPMAVALGLLAGGWIAAAVLVCQGQPVSARLEAAYLTGGVVVLVMGVLFKGVPTE